MPKTLSYSNLPALLLAKGELQDQIAEIVETVTSDRSLSGLRMWQSLAFSGVTLGIEEASRYTVKMMNDSIVFMRDTADKLDKLIPMVADLAVLEVLNEIRGELAGHLEQRAKVLQGIHVGQAAQEYGIDEETLMGPVEPADLPEHIIQYVGHTASRSNPANFVAWSQLTRFNRLDKLECKCTACMLQLVEKGTDERTELKAAIEHFSGSSNLFGSYAIFILSELRDNYARVISGEGERHNQKPTDAEQITRNVMEQMTGGRRRDDGSSLE